MYNQLLMHKYQQSHMQFERGGVNKLQCPITMSYKDSDYTIVIALMYRPKHIIFGAETHLGGGVMSAFIFLSTTIA